MAIALTNAQIQRIRELDGIPELGSHTFGSEQERESYFQGVVNGLVKKNRREIRRVALEHSRSQLGELQNFFESLLTSMGFAQVHTPTVISSVALERMGVGSGHPLHEQVFWLEGGKRCLRPMLAPNLYVVMKEITRSIKGNFGIFEVGSCFRKESKGSHHLEEFTMLNLVEVRPEGRPLDRLQAIIQRIEADLGIPLTIVPESSEVYGSSYDVLAKGVEVASAAFGPHPLDRSFDVDFAWMGVGIGLERLIMMKAGSNNIRRHARSVVYLNGARMDI